MPDTSFNYLTAEKTRLYRAVMRAFSQAKERFLVHLRPEDVIELAARGGDDLTLEEVQTALAQLVEWGNLNAEPDTSRVTTVEDFYRARYLYQLSHAGEAAEAALATYERMLKSHGALQTVALADIAAQLRAMLALLNQQDDAADSGKAHLLLRDISRVFNDLAENARDFMSGLARGMDLRRAERDAFIAYKDRLLEYLRQFIGDLVTRSAQIAELIGQIERHPRFDPVLRGISKREAADLAPALTEETAAAVDPAWAEAQALAQWQSRWEGLGAWFVGAPGRQAQAELLRARARRAISDLLQAIVQLNERRLGRSDRSADFRTLAGWFMDCADDADAHRLWRGAFGLTPARHLGIDSDTLSERADNPIPPPRAWPEALPLMISPRLRETGSFRKRGVPPRVRDRAADKQRLAQVLAQESLQARAARRRLASGEQTQLSAIGTLDSQAFALFLRLLGEALSSARHPDETIDIETRDGTIALRLEPLEADSRAEIHSPDGVFTGRDYLVCIRDLDLPRDQVPLTDEGELAVGLDESAEPGELKRSDEADEAVA